VKIDQGLLGVRVIELDHHSRLGVAFCGKNLAELGAEVVKLEFADGCGIARCFSQYDGLASDDETCPSHLYLDTGKKSVAVTWEDGQVPATLAPMLATADVLLLGHQPHELRASGLDLQQIRGLRPGLVIVSLTPFGLSGPYCEREATDAVVTALAGHLDLTGRPGCAPLRYGSMFGEYLLGLSGSVATLAALAALSNGMGGQLAEVSALEALVKAIENAAILPATTPFERHRSGNRYYSTGAVLDFFPCSDGFVMNTAFTERQWRSLCALVERPEWMTDVRLSNWPDRLAHEVEIVQGITEWTESRTREVVFTAAQARRIPLMKVLSPQEVLADPQVQHHASFAAVDHPRAGKGCYVRFPAVSETTSRPVRRAPLLGEDDGFHWPPRQPTAATTRVASKGALDGLRIVDMTQVYAGPLATAILADLGAEVIKVESPQHPDLMRLLGSELSSSNGASSAETSWWFQWVNRNKREISVDLSSKDGHQVLLDLITHSDVVIDNFSARVMPRLGLSAEILLERNPGLIVVSMPPFALSGPYRDYLAYGEALECMTALPWVTGYSDADGPMRAGAALCDPNAAFHAALTILAALRARSADSGAGGQVYVSQHEAYMRMHGDLYLDVANAELHRWGNRQPGFVLQGVFQATDGWIVISARNDSEWDRLATLVGRPDIRSTRGSLSTSNRDDPCFSRMENAVGEWTVRLTREEASTRCAGIGLAAAPVKTPVELFDDEHLQSRGFFIDCDHPSIGTLPLEGFAFQLSDAPARVWRHGPLFGQDTDWVLQTILGKSTGEIESLRRSGAVGMPRVQQ